MKEGWKKLPIEAKQGLVLGSLTRYCREYGTIRIAKLDNGAIDIVVLISPPMAVPGDVLLPAVTLLDGQLYDLMADTYGSVPAAACAFGLAGTSCHFTDCKQEG